MNALHCYITVVILLYIDLTVFGQAPVEYEPEFLEDLENHTVAQGRDVSFTCVVNHLGTYKVAWIKSDSKAILAIHTHLVAHNNRLSVTHNGHNTWRLKVANVQKNDSGTYMCQINTDPMKSQMGHLEVVVPPDILNEGGDEDHIAIEGGTVKLKCRATGSPEPRVTWKRDDSKDIVFRNEQSRNKVVKSFEGEVLQLNNVQRTDMGSYYCMANNGVPPIIRKSFLIQIHFHPVVKVSNQLVAAPIGSDVHIQCYVETSPKAMHEWFKDTGEKLMEGPKFEMTETQVNEYTLFLNLTIRILEKRDFGSYTCSSSSAMGDAKGTIRLQELHIPKTTVAPVINVNEAHKPRKKPATHSKDHLNHGRNRNNKKKQALEDILLPEETGDEKKVATTPESRVLLPFPTYRTPPWTLLKEKVSSSQALSVNMLLPLFLIFLLVRL